MIKNDLFDTRDIYTLYFASFCQTDQTVLSEIVDFSLPH